MKHAILLLPALAALTTAQYAVLQYGTGELPDCAKNCQTLTTAAQGCIPPAAPVTSQEIYDNCFCQSNFLANNLAVGSSSSISTVCNTACTAASDQKAIQVWYDSLCNPTSTTTGTATTTAGAATKTTTGTTTGKTTGTATSTATSSTTSGTSAASSTNESSGQKWWAQHARWIAMAIVLIVAFIVIGLLGMWLKRRNTRKHQRRAEMAPPVVWGPHQNQHHTGGVAYGGGASREKGKQRAGNNDSRLPTASQGPVDYSEKDGTKKLKKFFRK